MSAVTPDHFRRWSLATHLTLWYAGSAFVLVVVATGFLYAVLVHHFRQEDAAQIAERVDEVRSQALRPGCQLAGLEEIIHPRGLPGTWWIRLRDVQGHTIAATPPSAGTSAETSAGTSSETMAWATFPLPAPGPEDKAEVISKRDSADASYLLASAMIAVSTSAPPSMVIMEIAFSNAAEAELLERYRWWMVIVLMVTGLAASAGAYALVKGGLRPVTDLSAVIHGIGSGTLAARVPVAGLPIEVASLAVSFNDMLDRLEGSFDRLSQFTADIAHELRTPVGNVRGELEVALGRPRTVDEYCDVMGSCLEECTRLTTLIETLLFLARAEHPRNELVRHSLDLGRDLRHVVEFYHAVADDAGIRMSCSTPDDLMIDADRLLIQRAVSNLIENALDHTPRGGEISVCATSNNEFVYVAVADTGCGIPPEHRAHVFDRYHQAPRKSRPSGRLGLGLAIVRGISHVHGGTVELISEQGTGTIVTIRLPRQVRLP